MKETNDPSFERRAEAHKIPWKIGPLVLNAVDVKLSLENRARKEPIKEEVVDDYALAMARGEPFPMIVVLLLASGKYMILSGNHRFKAMLKNSVKECQAYIIDGTGKDCELLKDFLPRVLNRDHGQRQTRDEALESAIWLIAHHAYTTQKAADEFNVPVAAIQTELRLDEQRQYLEQNGVNALKITKKQLNQLNPLRRNKSTLVAAAQMATKINGDQFDTFIADVKAETRSEAAQMRVIADWQDKLGGAAKPEPLMHTHRPIRTRFFTNLTGIKNLAVKVTDWQQLQITSAEERSAACKDLKIVAKWFRVLLAKEVTGEKQ